MGVIFQKKETRATMRKWTIGFLKQMKWIGMKRKWRNPSRLRMTLKISWESVTVKTIQTMNGKIGTMTIGEAVTKR